MASPGDYACVLTWPLSKAQPFLDVSAITNLRGFWLFFFFLPQIDHMDTVQKT